MKRENVSTNNCSHLKIMRTIFLWMSLQVAVSTLQSISRTLDTRDKKRTFSKLYFLTRESEDKTQTRAITILPIVKREDEDSNSLVVYPEPNIYKGERTFIVFIYCGRRLTMPVESIISFETFPN